jgi:hypothetical protein
MAKDDAFFIDFTDRVDRRLNHSSYCHSAVTQ